jgi:ATP-dependent Clp protease ATP-binding subunit ClpB
LGASEMESILHPKLGFRFHEPVVATAAQAGRLDNAGTSAARKRFSPEFMNRIDRTVVFSPLGQAELHQILSLELDAVLQRIRLATGAASIQCTVNDGARDFLLAEGTDTRYGARHLKRAVERLLVQPIANLIASDQLQSGDALSVEFDKDVKRLVFAKDTPVVVGTVAA